MLGTHKSGCRRNMSQFDMYFCTSLIEVSKHLNNEEMTFSVDLEVLQNILQNHIFRRVNIQSCMKTCRHARKRRLPRLCQATVQIIGKAVTL